MRGENVLGEVAWELERRKDILIERKRGAIASVCDVQNDVLHEIDPVMLTEPKLQGKPTEHYVGTW